MSWSSQGLSGPSGGRSCFPALLPVGKSGGIPGSGSAVPAGTKCACSGCVGTLCLCFLFLPDAIGPDTQTTPNLRSIV